MSIRTLLLGLSTLLAASTVQAGWDGFWSPYFYNQFRYTSDSPPYYAVYPPVYYSYPVPRTYGYSPYAYPPGVMTPELKIEEIPAPKVMSNPYFKEEAKPGTIRATSARSKVVVNPYYYEDAGPEGDRAARR